jgi:hypothetical protein
MSVSAGRSGAKREFCLFCELELLVHACFTRSGHAPRAIVQNIRCTSAQPTWLSFLHWLPLDPCELALTFDTHAVPLVVAVLSKSFRPGRQEDSHEFIRFVLDALQTKALAAFTK